MLFVWLVIIQLLIFGALVVFLRVIMLKNISSATTHLNDINRDYTQKLEDAQRRLQEAEKNYDETILKAKIDSEKLKSQILKEARSSQETILNDSRRQSEQIIESANKTRESLLKEMEERIAEESVAKACELMQQVLPTLFTKELHTQWVEELAKEGLQELERMHIAGQSKTVKIISAYPLSGDQRSLIQKKLKERLHREIEFEEQVSADLIAGIKIQMGSLVIDGSLLFKIKEISRHARRRVS